MIRPSVELLSVAREMKRRGLPLDAIVVDFFHWTRQGDFRFEPRDWPNPQAMVDELKAMGVETVVSVWPTIDEKSANFGEMAERGLLVTADRGNAIVMTWMGNTFFFDATNPEAQAFVWEQCKKNYYQYGIRCFWLDESEPEYGPYDFDNYRYYAGPALQCTNTYPAEAQPLPHERLRQHCLRSAHTWHPPQSAAGRNCGKQPAERRHLGRAERPPEQERFGAFRRPAAATLHCARAGG